MDPRFASPLRSTRSRLSLAISLALLGSLSPLYSEQASAACNPASPGDGMTVTCTGINQQNFNTSASNLTVSIASGAVVGASASGAPAMQLLGSNYIITNSGHIYASSTGQQSLLTTGLKVGSSAQQNISITNASDGVITGTSADLGASIVDLKGMAIDAQAGAGGKITLVNSGQIYSDVIVGASERIEMADIPIIAAYGGAQIELVNNYELYGRIAFQASAQGNIFTNNGTLMGSLSLGAGGGANQFNAVTGSSVTTFGGTGTTSITVDSNPNLVFVRPGVVDGGAGGSNTLALQNAIGGGSGTAGAGSISSSSFINFSNLLLQSGTWTVNGALLTGSTTSTSLTGGTLSVNNDAVFGNGDVSISGANLTTHATTANLANNFLIGSGGMGLSGTNTIVLNGVISGGVTGLLTKNHGGILRLNGVNTYAGGTALNGGTTVVSKDEAFGTGAIAIGSTGARIDASGTVNLVNDIGLSANGTFGGTGNLTLSGVISNTTSRTVAKVGSGQLTLAKANTYQGGTTLSGGTLVVGNNQALGSGGLTVASASILSSSQSVALTNAVALNSNLTVNGTNNLSLDGTISGAVGNKLIKTGSGNLTLSAANSFQGGIELNGGSITAATDSGVFGGGGLTVTGDSSLFVNVAQSISTPITINNGGWLNLDTNNDVQLTGTLSGVGNFEKLGTGEVTLSQAGTLSGTVIASEGTLTTQANDALGVNHGLVVSSGATVKLGGNSSIRDLIGDGTLQINSGTTSIGNSNASSNFSGVIAGGSVGALSKVGTGTLTLSGTNTFTGNTTVSGGRLNIASGASLASSQVAVNNGATLGGGGTLTGQVTVNSGGHLSLTSGSTLTAGNLSVNTGIVDVALGAPSLTPMANVTGNLSLSNTQFSFSDLANIDNGTYRLITFAGLSGNAGSSIIAMPNGFLPGEIILQYVPGGLNVIVNSLSLAAQYWDGAGTQGDGVVTGGSGVWNSSATNWTKASGNAVSSWQGVAAIFQGAAGQVSIEGTQSASSLQFKSDGYSLGTATGGMLSLVNGSGGSATLGTDTSVTALIDGQVGGSGRLEKTGAGTLVLAGNNNYSGGTALSAGTLIVRNNNALASGALDLASGTTLSADTLDVQLSNSVTLSGMANVRADNGTTLSLNGSLSGTGGLVKIGEGSLVLGGNNSQQGNTELNRGTLVLGSNTALGAGTLNTFNGTSLDSTPGGVQVSSNVAISGTLNVLGSHDLSLGGTISGTGTLIKSGSSALDLTGANTLNGTVTLNQGTLRLAQNTSLGNATLQIDGASTLQSTATIALSNTLILNDELTVSGSNNLTLSGQLSGSAGLVKDGSGRLTLSGANSYRGDTNLQDGTLLLSNASALGLGRLDVTGSGALEGGSSLTIGNDIAISGALTVQGSNDLTLDGSVTGTGSLTKTGSTTLTLNGSGGFVGDYHIDGGLLVSSTLQSLGNPTTVDLASGATLQLLAGATIGQLIGAGNVAIDSGQLQLAEGTFSGALSGNGELYKQGSGTLLLSGTSNLAGATTVTNGTLQVNGSLGNGSVYVQSGATLAGNGSLGGAVSVANGGHLSIQSGAVLDVGSLVLNNTSNINAALGTATPGAAGLVNVSGNLTLDGSLNITDTGGFGMGVYRLFDYGGLLTDNGLQLGALPAGIPGSELQVQTSVANQINLVVGAPADIRFWDGSASLGNGSVEGGNGVWNSSNTNWTTSTAGLNGTWNDSFAVFQGTPGTVTVDGTQNLNGLQFISDYTLNPGTAGLLQLVSSSHGYTSVRVDNGQTATLNVSLTGNGILNKLDTGTLVLNGNNSHTDGTRLSGGTLVLGNNNALGSGNLTVYSGTTLDNNKALSLINDVILDGTLTLAGSHDLTLNGLLMGYDSLVKNGSATLTLNNSNDYAGTTLNAGTLVLGNSAALGSGQLAIGGTASLDTSAVMTVGNAIDFGLSTAANLTVAGSHDLTLSGALSGDGTLIKQGNATLALSGSNNFQGTYQIDAGQLNLLASNSSTDTAVNLGAAGTLGIGADSTLRTLNGQGAVQLFNNSALTLSTSSYGGSLSGNGSLVIASGTVALSGNNSYNGGTLLNAGSLNLGHNAALGTGALSVLGNTHLDSSTALSLNNAIALTQQLTLTGSHDLTLSGALSGNGNLVKNGSSQLVLTGNSTYTGNTSVNAGGLTVNGSFSSANVHIANGAILAGSGTLSGQVSLADGAHLHLSSATAPLTLGGLSLSSNSQLNADLDAPNNSTALVQVNGDLILDGQLNVTDLGGFGLGVYRLINYTGTLTDRGLQLGTLPGNTSSYTTSLQTQTSQQVNLIVGGPSTLLFWDGNNSAANGHVDGGSGIWDSTRTNWTQADGASNNAWNGQFAVFQGTSGNVTLNGAQQLTGMQFVTDGYVLNAGTGAELLTTGATNIRVDSGSTATLNLAINGSGTLNKLDSGTLVLNSANGYSGGTHLKAGALILGHQNALGSGVLITEQGTTLGTTAALAVSNDMQLNGDLQLAANGDLSLSGNISGAGSLTKQGNHRLTLSGDNSFSGFLNVLSGDLELLGTNALGNATLKVAEHAFAGFAGHTVLGSLAGDGDISLNPGSLLQIGGNNSDSTYNGNINGQGQLIKSGTGKTILNGQSQLDSTQINAGSFIIGASAGSTARLTSDVQVGNGATFGGHGSLLGQLTLASGATLSPGNSIGTFNVQGDVNFNPGSIFEVEVQANGSHDKLIASGNVGLGGSDLKVLAEAGNWAPSTSYQIIQASDISGSFANVSTDLAFLTPELSYSATQVELTLKRNQVGFASLGQTYNQQAVAHALESLGSGTLYNSILSLSEAQAISAYDSLSGELYASAQSALFDDSRYVRDAISQRLRAAQGQPSSSAILHTDDDSGATFWLQSYGGWGNSNASHNNAAMEHDSQGTLLGIDLPLGDNWRAGVAAGYGSNKLKLDARNASAEIDSTSLTLFAAGQWDAINLRLGASHVWNDVDSSRHLQVGALSERAKAHYDAKTSQVFAELGYAIQAGDFTLEPFAGLSYVKVDSDSFKEQAEHTALRGASQQRDVTYSTLGVHASTPLTHLGSVPVMLQGTLGWQHAFDELKPKQQLAFDGSQGFSVQGMPLAQDSGIAKIALSAQVAKGTTVDVGYTGQFGDGHKDNSIRLGLSVSF